MVRKGQLPNNFLKKFLKRPIDKLAENCH